MSWGTNEHVSSVSSFAAGPPSSPLNGDVWVATEAGSTGEVWSFRYNAGSGSTYKWEFIGGPPVRSEVATLQTTTTTSSWLDLATVGPSITPARAGDYLYMVGTTLKHSASGVQIYAYLNGATYTPGCVYTTAAANQEIALSAAGRINALAASTLLKLQYYNAAAGTLTAYDRFLEVTPVRVI